MSFFGKYSSNVSGGGGGGGGTGDVVGPSSATDNGVALFDGTTGKLLKNSSEIRGVGTGALSVGKDFGITTYGISLSHNGSVGLLIERDPSPQHYQLLWDDNSTGWGFAANPAVDTNKVYYKSYGTGNLMSFEDSSGAAKFSMLGTGGKITVGTDAGCNLGDITHRFDKAYFKTNINLGATDAGVSAQGTIATLTNGSGIVAGYLSGTTSRFTFNDGVTGQCGFYCDTNVMDTVTYKVVAGTSILSFTAAGIIGGTDGSASLGTAAKRFDKLYLKTLINVGDDAGVSAVGQIACLNGNAGTVMGFLSGTTARIVFNDGVTGQWGWYSDCNSPSNIEYRIVGGTVMSRFNSSGNLELLADNAPASTADKVILSAVDLSAGNRTLAISTETAVAAAIAVASTNSLSVKINGTTYKILLAT